MRPIIDPAYFRKKVQICLRLATELQMGQRATYRYVVTMSDMRLTTDIGGMPIGLFRCDVAEV